jgi:ribonucleotide reductase beta subunit family protein with ferritin-like domain
VDYEEQSELFDLWVNCSDKLEQYAKIKQIIDEYNRQPSCNVFTNDKYFRKILEVFEVD